MDDEITKRARDGDEPALHPPDLDTLMEWEAEGGLPVPRAAG
jgi:hypothetical protein